jgi:hypothetical protein
VSLPVHGPYRGFRQVAELPYPPMRYRFLIWECQICFSLVSEEGIEKHDWVHQNRSLGDDRDDAGA